MNTMMKKAGMAVALAATVFTASAPAEAQRYGGGYRGGYHGGHGYRGGNVAGAALLGGIVGLGVGAAIADNHRGYYGYGPGHYGPAYRGYYYGGYYGPHCWRQLRWDPYYGRDVVVRVCN